mgnify:CR=1 FL=1
MDFRDALIGDRLVTVTVIDANALAMALSQIGQTVGVGALAAMEHYRRTGEILPGVSVSEDEPERP